MARPPGHRLDDIDIKIVKILLNSPKSTLGKLANDVGIAKSSVKARKDYLELREYIKRRIEVVRGRSSWKDVRILYITLPSRDNETTEKIFAHLIKVPEIQRVDQVTGKPDILVRIEARDGIRFEAIRQDIMGIMPGIEIDTTGVIRTIKDEQLPAEALVST